MPFRLNIELWVRIFILSHPIRFNYNERKKSHFYSNHFVLLPFPFTIFFFWFAVLFFIFLFIMGQFNYHNFIFYLRSGNEKVVELLINKKAKIDVKDDEKATPLCKAHEKGKAKMIVQLKSIACFFNFLLVSFRHFYFNCKYSLQKTCYWLFSHIFISFNLTSLLINH